MSELFPTDQIEAAAKRIADDKNLMFLVQIAERHQLTVAEVSRRLASDEEFREDVMLWLGLHHLRENVRKAAMQAATTQAARPKILPAGGRRF